MTDYSLLNLDDALRNLEGNLAMACNDAAVDVIRRARDTLDRYRYAVAYAAAESWDGTSDTRKRFEWARTEDDNGHLADNRLAEIGQKFPG